MNTYVRELARAVLPPRWYYYLRDRWSFDEVRCVHRVLKGNAVDRIMIDVGAHVGTSLASFALDGWTIHAFEPDDINRSELVKLCHRANFDNVKIGARAVSEKCENELKFYRSDISSGISGLSVFHSGHREVQVVSTTTLADYCLENVISKVDFLKIDTEGWDYFVLKGFPFKEIKPRVVLAEFEDHKTSPLGYGWEDMAQFLTGRGVSRVRVRVGSRS